MPVLAAAFAASLAAAPLPAACPAPVGLGPADAPAELIAFVDPLTPGGLGLWLELRRLVSDLQGHLRIRFEPAAGPTHDLAGEQLLRWAVAVADRGAHEGLLRLLDRDGRDRLALRLARPDGPAELTAALAAAAPAAAAPALPDARAEACAVARVESARRALKAQQQRAGGYLGRPPLFVLAAGDRVAFEDSGGLERVRSEVTRELQRLRAGRPAARNAWPPARPGVSARLIRPPADAGMLVGGVGLPHRLVLFVEHDEHPNLGNLVPVLEWRRAHPGRLAVQIIARGTTGAARQLRQRLCAARHLGLELEYLRRLARDPLMRAVHEPVPLGERLDEAADAHKCDLGEPELEPGPGGVQSLPDGAWLDGTAVGQGDLEAIGARILGLEAAQRPLDAVFSAAAPAEI
ncbi:MAG: hypothetical protein JNL82_02200 [Myxococcales bacterium]|nr:hypothetical protein [Myxococcales bacterium]